MLLVNYAFVEKCLEDPTQPGSGKALHKFYHKLTVYLEEQSVKAAKYEKSDDPADHKVFVDAWYVTRTLRVTVITPLYNLYPALTLLEKSRADNPNSIDTPFISKYMKQYGSHHDYSSLKGTPRDLLKDIRTVLKNIKPLCEEIMHNYNPPSIDVAKEKVSKLLEDHEEDLAKLAYYCAGLSAAAGLRPTIP